MGRAKAGKSDAREAYAVASEIGVKYFKGRDPEQMGAILLVLMSKFLAGVVCLGNEEETERVREQILREFIAAVRDMVPVEAMHSGTDRLADVQGGRQ